MDSSPNNEVLTRSAPVVTIAVVTTALVVWFVPGLRDVLIFDRVEILRGEVWRVFTGAFVHFSVSHLVCDLVVVFVAGRAVERLGRLRYGLLCLIAQVFVGLGVLTLETQTRFYGGLSGLAMCLLVVLGVEWLLGRRMKWLGALVWGAVIWKLAGEIGTTSALVADLGVGVVRSQVAHFVGAAVGVLWSLAVVFRRKAAEGCRSPRREALS